MVHVVNQFSVAEECDIRNKFETNNLKYGITLVDQLRFLMNENNQKVRYESMLNNLDE